MRAGYIRVVWARVIFLGRGNIVFGKDFCEGGLLYTS